MTHAEQGMIIRAGPYAVLGAGERARVRRFHLQLGLSSAGLAIQRERRWKWEEGQTNSQGELQPVRTNWNLQPPLTASRPLPSLMRGEGCRRSWCPPPQSCTWTGPGFGKWKVEVWPDLEELRAQQLPHTHRSVGQQPPVWAATVPGPCIHLRVWDSGVGFQPASFQISCTMSLQMDKDRDSGKHTFGLSKLKAQIPYRWKDYNLKSLINKVL